MDSSIARGLLTEPWARTAERHTWASAAGEVGLIVGQAVGAGWNWRFRRMGPDAPYLAGCGGQQGTRLLGQRSAELAAGSLR